MSFGTRETDHAARQASTNRPGADRPACRSSSARTKRLSSRCPTATSRLRERSSRASPRAIITSRLRLSMMIRGESPSVAPARVGGSDPASTSSSSRVAASRTRNPWAKISARGSDPRPTTPRSPRRRKLILGFGSDGSARTRRPLTRTSRGCSARCRQLSHGESRRIEVVRKISRSSVDTPRSSTTSVPRLIVVISCSTTSSRPSRRTCQLSPRWGRERTTISRGSNRSTDQKPIPKRPTAFELPLLDEA